MNHKDIKTLRHQGPKPNFFVSWRLGVLVVFFGCGLMAALRLIFLEGVPAIAADKLPLVQILATGGTIANTAGGRVSIEEVYKAVPQIREHARIEFEELARIPSNSVTPELVIRIGVRIHELEKKSPEIAGYVVTHGSNSSEETAFMLNLLVHTKKPVVVTAAQRKFGTISSDSPKNLLDSIRVAADPQSRGRGVLMVANDLINSARDVTKTVSFRVETFTSRDLGVLGYVEPEGIFYYRQSTRKHTMDSVFHPEELARLGKLPRVDLLYTYAGDDGSVARMIGQELKPDGIVVASFATGGLTPGLLDELKKLHEKGVIIVQSHRAGEGRLRRASDSSHFITADNLNPQKARILLQLALTRTRAISEIQKFFDEY